MRHKSKSSSFKSRLRTLLGPKLWKLSARCYGKIMDAIAILVAPAVMAVLRILPEVVRLEVRRKLILVRRLDFGEADLRIYVTSRIERSARLRSCEKEPETIHWLKENLHSGDVFYDIGANVGAYSLIAAHLADHKAIVYAFEASYSTFLRMQENIALNACEGRIIPLPLALGSANAVARFGCSSLEPGSANHAGFNNGDASFWQQTMCFSLDDLIRLFSLPTPTLVKLDVDGGEMAVLEGAAETLKNAGLRSVLVEADTTLDQTEIIRESLNNAGFCLSGDYLHSDGTTRNWIFKRDTQIGAAVICDGFIRSLGS